MIKRFEPIVTVIALFVFTGAITSLWLETDTSTRGYIQGDKTQQLISLIIYIVICIFILFSGKKFYKVAFSNFFIWALLLWAFLSILWSAEPNVSIRRSMAVLLTTIIGVYLAGKYELSNFLRLLSYTFFLVSILSYILIIYYPELGIMSYGSLTEGGWKGVFSHKNSLGKYSSIACVTFLIECIYYRRKTLWIVGLFLSIGLLLGSSSVTSILITGILLTSIPLLKLMGRRNKYFGFKVTLMLLLFFFVFWLFAENSDILLDFFGKDSTLTGRTSLWNIAIYMALKHMWKGYGFNAFWLGNEGPSSYVWQNLHFNAPHAHNGYIDLWLSLGLIGLALYMLIYISTFLRSVNWFLNLKGKKQVLGIWPISLLIFLLFLNFTESTILSPNNTLWALFVMISFLNLKQSNHEKQRIRDQEERSEYILSSKSLHMVGSNCRQRV